MTDANSDRGGAGLPLPRRFFISPVPSAMLNPAVFALVVAAATEGHAREEEAGLPWELSFVLAPLVFHRGSREALPQRVSTHLPVWVSRHPAIRAGFPSRATSLVGPVREGLRFGLRYGQLVLADGRLEASAVPRRIRDEHLSELVAKATFVGRWFSKLDQTATAFALFGVSV